MKTKLIKINIKVYDIKVYAMQVKDTSETKLVEESSNEQR